MQQQHVQLRASFLEDLPEAIVIHHSPDLTFDSMEIIRKECALKQLKQLKFRERMRRTYKKISNTLKPFKQFGLQSLDLPDGNAIDHHFGDPTIPKTWTSPWKNLMDPTAIT